MAAVELSRDVPAVPRLALQEASCHTRRRYAPPLPRGDASALGDWQVRPACAALPVVVASPARTTLGGDRPAPPR
eukprot:1181100-Prymnesium_polylepis.1